MGCLNHCNIVLVSLSGGSCEQNLRTFLSFVFPELVIQTEEFSLGHFCLKTYLKTSNYIFLKELNFLGQNFAFMLTPANSFLVLFSIILSNCQACSTITICYYHQFKHNFRLWKKDMEIFSIKKEDP